MGGGIGLEHDRLALHAGQRVYVASLRKEAEVAARSGPGDREVEVRAGGIKLRVSREQVRVFPAEARAAESLSGKAARSGEEGAPEVFLQTPANTLDLRGRYVEDALPEVEAFLDRLSLEQAPHAFLIHGHGTGALKSGVRRYLKGSPYAKRFFPAPREQGGDGATIVLIA